VKAPKRFSRLPFYHVLFFRSFFNIIFNFSFCSGVVNFSTKGFSGAKTIKVAPKIVSGRVVKTSISVHQLKTLNLPLLLEIFQSNILENPSTVVANLRF
jgi:hypothetical protein